MTTRTKDSALLWIGIALFFTGLAIALWK